MTDNQPADLVAEVREALAAATPAPWRVAEVDGWVGVDPVCSPHGAGDAAEISGGDK